MYFVVIVTNKFISRILLLKLGWQINAANYVYQKSKSFRYCHVSWDTLNKANWKSNFTEKRQVEIRLLEVNRKVIWKTTFIEHKRAKKILMRSPSKS